MKKTSWLAVMVISMMTAGVPYFPEKELALDATKWTFERPEERRVARKQLNEKTPRCLLAQGGENNDYAIELAKWQYRTGSSFLLATKKKNDALRKLVALPGVRAISFGRNWTCGSKVSPRNVTTLVTNVEEIAKSIHKSLKQAEVEGREHFTKNEASKVLQSVADGCKEELRRQNLLLDVPEEDAEPATKTDAEETWLMKRGRDVGQKAVSVFIQLAKREE